MKKLLILLVLFVACEERVLVPVVETQVEYIYIHTDGPNNPIEFSSNEFTAYRNGVFVWVMCRNKSDSITWHGHVEVKLEDAEEEGRFEETRRGYLTTKFDWVTNIPVDTLSCMLPLQRAEAWYFYEYDWINMEWVIPWFYFVTDSLN